MWQKFTETTRRILLNAEAKAREINSPIVTVDLLFYAFLEEKDSIAYKILVKLGYNVSKIEKDIQRMIKPIEEEIEITDSPVIDESSKEFMDIVFSEAKILSNDYVGSEHFLLGFLSYTGTKTNAILLTNDVSYDVIKKELEEFNGVNITQNKQSDRINKTRSGSSARSSRVAETKEEKSVLEEYSVDLTSLAEQGKLDPCVGREDVINRVIQILSRRTKNNPCLIGDAGIGKTSIVEGLAQKIVDGSVPKSLQNKRIVSIDIGHIVAGAKYRGEFEERLEKVISEVKASDGNIIVFIDEVHTIVGAGSAEGSLDAANIIKPSLTRREFQCICATTANEFKKSIENDPALERRLQVINVKEPNVEETMNILNGLRERYEDFHGVQILDEAIKATCNLSDRYITDRSMPDKAIDVLDEACAKIKLKNENNDIDVLYVTEDDITRIVEEWTGIPVVKLKQKETEKLLHLEKDFHKRIVGQEKAIKTLSKAIRRSRVGLHDPKKPIGSFIFLGPTGVGKTEVAKTLAELVFGSENNLVRLDMSEYMEKHSVSRLIGAPPGYVGYDEGGILTEAVKRNPYSILLFDEIEKAHADIFNVLLQLLDDGRLTDSKGRIVDFKNTIIIMTGNIGANFFTNSEKLGFISSNNNESKNINKNINDELKKIFRPEFLNRVDDIVIFESLTRAENKEIVKLLIGKLEVLLKLQGYSIKISDEAIDYLVEKGIDKQFGARPLKRTIQKEIEDVLAEEILAQKFNSEDVIRIDVLNGELAFTNDEDSFETHDEKKELLTIK